MNAIDNLVFNTLVQHGAVYLPAIGTLHVVCKPAGREAKAPKAMVAFSKSAVKNSVSIIDLAVRQDGIDAQGARSLYEEWLSGARRDGKIVIEGVGTLGGRNFSTEAELMTALNGEETSAVTCSTKGSKCWIWWVVAAVVIAAGVLFYLFCPWCSKCCDKKVAEVETVAVVETETEPEAVAEPVATVAPVGNARYNISVGVFAVPENAAKCAASDPVGIGAENYLIAPFPSGMKVVIAYSTDDWNDAVNAWRKFKKSVSEVWIYKKY